MRSYYQSMNAEIPALVLAAAGVGAGHAVLPDHWLPLTMVARTRRYGLGRVARLAGVAGCAHVGLSLVLGAVVAAVGLRFRAAVQDRVDVVTGVLLIATGLAFLLSRARRRGHEHPHPHDHGHEHDRPVGRWWQVAGPLGAAASPDLTILPVFLAAGAVGALAAVGALVAFSLATVGTFVGLTLAGAALGARVHGRWLDAGATVVTGLILLGLGAVVAAGLI
jgi:hypothetical protein